MNAQQLAALAEEIQTDPKGKGYAAHLPTSPGLVVELLNAPTESMVKALRTTTAKAWAATGPMARIVDAANDSAHACRASCLTVLESFRSGDLIHVEMVDIQQMLVAWVQLGVCTSSERDDLMARAVQPASRAEVLGLPPVTEYDLIESGAIL